MTTFSREQLFYFHMGCFSMRNEVRVSLLLVPARGSSCVASPVSVRTQRAARNECSTGIEDAAFRGTGRESDKVPHSCVLE